MQRTRFRTKSLRNPTYWKHLTYNVNQSLKLHAYTLCLSALKMIQDYLLNRRQRKKLDSLEVHGRILYGMFHKALF